MAESEFADQIVTLFKGSFSGANLDTDLNSRARLNSNLIDRAVSTPKTQNAINIGSNVFVDPSAPAGSKMSV